MYDPSIGRWMEEDPDQFAAGDSNLSRYVKNDPTNATDPTGLTMIMAKLLYDAGITLVDRGKWSILQEQNRLAALAQVQ